MANHTELFFDDYRLFGRAGTERAYGVPELAAVYTDPLFSTDYPSPFVVKKDGRTFMLYMGKHRETKQAALLAAVSDDGIHFVPWDTTEIEIENRLSINELMPLWRDKEPFGLIECPEASADERYKMILTDCEYGRRFEVFAYVLASPDLLHWHRCGGEIPGWSTEPIGGIFRNEQKGGYTILHRTTWGNRDVGYTDTKDFVSFSPYELCMRQDSLDAPLDEIYGMPAVPYAGMFIGFPCIYTDNAPSRCVKFNPGNTYPQLAYSWDGHHWQRSLRTSFLPDYHGQPSLSWLMSAQTEENGDILLYAAHSDEAHGVAFSSNKTGVIRVYRLRKDGFIRLTAGEKTATVITREWIFGGGELAVNLSAEYATAAILTTDEEDTRFVDVLGRGRPVPGFDHGDCEPFSGDSTAWVPHFSGGSLDRFRDKTVLIEIRYRNGDLYSLSGALTPITSAAAGRYRLHKRLAEKENEK